MAAAKQSLAAELLRSRAFYDSPFKVQVSMLARRQWRTDVSVNRMKKTLDQRHISASWYTACDIRNLRAADCSRCSRVLSSSDDTIRCLSDARLNTTTVVR